MDEEERYFEEILKVERERYCHTQCHAKKPEDCIFNDIIFMKKIAK